MGGLGVILVALMISLVGCGPKKPFTSPELRGIIKLDSVKYSECMMAAQNEGIPMERLKKECEAYAEIVDEDLMEEKIKAINECLEIKKSEKWDEVELKFYCGQNWRAYR